MFAIGKALGMYRTVLGCMGTNCKKLQINPIYCLTPMEHIRSAAAAPLHV